MTAPDLSPSYRRTCPRQCSYSLGQWWARSAPPPRCTNRTDHPAGIPAESLAGRPQNGAGRPARPAGRGRLGHRQGPQHRVPASVEGALRHRTPSAGSATRPGYQRHLSRPGRLHVRAPLLIRKLANCGQIPLVALHNSERTDAVICDARGPSLLRLPATRRSRYLALRGSGSGLFVAACQKAVVKVDESVL